jgi:hypothetical protein
MTDDETRFRSFAERYLVGRAHHFEVGKEKEQAFLTIEDARYAYDQIATVAARRYGVKDDGAMAPAYGYAVATEPAGYVPSAAQAASTVKKQLKQLRGKI